jgi:hypothetical protein
MSSEKGCQSLRHRINSLLNAFCSIKKLRGSLLSVCTVSFSSSEDISEGFPKTFVSSSGVKSRFKHHTSYQKIIRELLIGKVHIIIEALSCPELLL